METQRPADTATELAVRVATHQQLMQQAAAPSLSLPEAQALLAEALAQQQALLLENQQLRATQQDLATSTSRLQAAEAVANMGSYQLDVATHDIHFSEGMYRLFGEEAGGFVPSLAWIDARSHPDDAAAVKQVLTQAIQHPQPYHYTRRIRHSDGQWRTLESHGRVVCDATGAAVRLEGVVEDVSARQRTERELLRLKEEVARQATGRYQALFEALDQGFCTIENRYDAQGRALDYRFLEVSASFEQQTGIRNGAGRWMREIAPDQDEFWFETYGRVGKTRIAEQFEHFSTPLSRWWSVYAFPIDEPGLGRIGVLFNDITERKHHEQRQKFLLQLSDALNPLSGAVAIQEVATRLSREFFQADRCYYGEINEGQCLIRHDASGEGLPSVAGVYRLDTMPLFRAVVAAGQPFVVDEVQTTDLVDDSLRQLCVQLQVISFVDVPVIKEGVAVGIWCVVQSVPRRWTPLEVALAQEIAERIWAAVERAQVEEALRESETRLRTLLANLPGGVAFIVGPDLRYQLAAGEALLATNSTPADFVGRHLAEVLPPAELATYEPFYRQALAGQAFIHEHETHGRTFISRGTPLRTATNEVSAALVVSYDITDRLQAEDARHQSEERLRLAIDAAELGTWDWDLVANEVYWNAHHFMLFGLEPQSSPVSLEDFFRFVHPDDRAAVLERLQAAVEDNGLLEMEFRVVTAQDELRWMSGHGQATAIGPDGRVRHMSGVMLDVTQRKHTEQYLQALAAALERKVERRTQDLQDSRDLLQSVYDTSLIGLAMLHAERDEATGTIKDFTFISANKELVRITGRTHLVGQRYAQEFSGLVPGGVLALMVAAVETGQPQQSEFSYLDAGRQRWLSVMFVKLDGGVVATVLDVTERKTAEQQLIRNLHLLEQAETVAQLGSWEYDLRSEQFQWSAGMYQLFGLPSGQHVTPRIYLDFVVPEDRPQAEQLVQRLTSGATDAEGTLRLRVGNAVKTMRIKAVVVRNAAQQAVSVLGVDLDLSELHRLEADNLRLRLRQQHILFEAVQAAEEEERRRMSESLHNGIGQLLFATKLQLDRLPPAPALSPRQEASRLLDEAIRQTRSLSHELTPAILEEFGLEKTLQSICATLNIPGLRWHCHLSFDEGPALPMSLQLAVYRLAQELAQNVLKHAHATEATLEVDLLPAWVVLRVEDNGRGFDSTHTHNGLGLRTLRSRTALLGGSFHLTTAPGRGTHCQIRLPLALPTA